MKYVGRPVGVPSVLSNVRVLPSFYITMFVICEYSSCLRGHSVCIVVLGRCVDEVLYLYFFVLYYGCILGLLEKMKFIDVNYITPRPEQFLNYSIPKNFSNAKQIK